MSFSYNTEALKGPDRKDKMDNGKFRWNDAINKTKEWTNVSAAISHTEMCLIEVLQWAFTTKSRRQL